MTVTETAAVRPDGFDLETAWRDVAASVEQRQTATRAVALVRPRILEGLWAQLGDDLAVLGTAPDGRAEIEVAGVTAEVIADELAGYGDDVEVVAPPAVRAHLARLGHELVGLYQEPDAPANEPADHR